MKPEAGYVYYIKDDYFKDVDDPCLMHNKGDGHRRPCYCCKMSDETGLYWMIPLSSQKTKFQKAYAQSLTKYGNCITLVLGQFSGKDAAFLIQNAFPVTEAYISDIYIANGNPVPVHSKLQKIIYGKFQGCMAIHRKGYHTFYTDVDKAQYIMLQKQYQKKAQLVDMISLAEAKRDKLSSPPVKSKPLQYAAE